MLAALGPYGAVLVSLLLGAIGVPLPEELVLLGAGAAAHAGVVDLVPMAIVAFVGVLATDAAIFELGRHFGPAALTKAPARWLLSPARWGQVERAIARHHSTLIFVARFLPGMRAPTFLVLGVHHVSRWRFFALDGLATLISVPAFVGIGYGATSSITRIAGDVARLEHVVVVVLAAALALTTIVAVIRIHRAPRR